MLRFKVEIYNAAIVFIMEDTIEKCAEVFRKVTKKSIDCKNVCAVTYYAEGQHTVYMLVPYPNFLSNLNHECIHATSYILHAVGVPISQENDEAFAYLNNFIFKKITNKYVNYAVKR
jgi:hypothetical protein